MPDDTQSHVGRVDYTISQVAPHAAGLVMSHPLYQWIVAKPEFYDIYRQEGGNRTLMGVTISRFQDVPNEKMFAFDAASLSTYLSMRKVVGHSKAIDRMEGLFESGQAVRTSFHPYPDKAV